MLKYLMHRITAILKLTLIVATSILCLAGCDFITDEKPIHKAATKGNLKAVKKLIDNDPTQVNIQNRLGWTPLYLASMEGHTEIVEFLLAHNANIELGNNMNERPLAKAAKFGHYDIVKTLLMSGATINCKDDFGQNLSHP